MKLTKTYFALAILAGVMGGVLGGSAVDTAKADPYKWCAIMGGGDDGGMISCYFLTFEQCQATVSGIGGFCRVNLWYDGRPEGSSPAVQPTKKQTQPRN